MSTTAPATPVTAAKVNFWKKLENFFLGAKTMIEEGLTDILGSQGAAAVEAGVSALLASEEGQIALTTVGAIEGANTGTLSIDAAAKAVGAALEAAGKTVTTSTINILVTAAQQKLAATFPPAAPPAPAAPATGN